MGGTYVFLENTVRALRLLSLGACLILVGLTCAVLLTPGSFWLPESPNDVFRLNMFGEPFPSGNPYVVTSVSAGVADWNSAPGKAFRATVLTGAIMILASDYPTYLSNVYIGGAKKNSFPITNSLRASVVPVGIVVVALCPVAEVNLTTIPEAVTLYGLHMVGALGAIIVYLVCEFSDLGDSGVKFGPGEKTIRTVLACLVLVSLVPFIVAQAIGSLGLGVCCDDVWLPVNATAINATATHKAWIQEADDMRLKQMFLLKGLDPASSSPLYKGLYDTAHSSFLVARVFGFWSEYAIFFWMLFSHLVVWYFSPERQRIWRHAMPSVKLV